jgi:hypothetical protein
MHCEDKLKLRLYNTSYCLIRGGHLSRFSVFSSKYEDNSWKWQSPYLIPLDHLKVASPITSKVCINSVYMFYDFSLNPHT